MDNENKEQESIENDMNVTVDKSKRKFSKAGLAAPVIMTLASKPVFAVQGLSGMMSGNTSNHCHDVKYGGMSPGFWKTPSGTTDFPGEDRWDIAWNKAGYTYGILRTPVILGDGCDEKYVNENSCLEIGDTIPNPNYEPNYDEDGVDVSTDPISIIITKSMIYNTANEKIRNENTRTITFNGKKWDHYQLNSGSVVTELSTGGRDLREMLNEEPGANYFHWIAGLLNARYFDALAASSGGASQYIFTETEFWDIFNNESKYFGSNGLLKNTIYTNLADLIESNYHSTPAC